MKLSAPLFHLKRRAKALSRTKTIPLHRALDQIAVAEGFKSWSQLAASNPVQSVAKQLLAQLAPGDLVLVGARPGQGKTSRSLELLAEVVKTGGHGAFFSFEYNHSHVQERVVNASGYPVTVARKIDFDNSDLICADYIIMRMRSAPRHTTIVIDYLQLLDQKRSNPPLMMQVRSLKSFAQEQGVIIVFITQIDRSFELSDKICPGLEDVRLPNPLDLDLFDMACFLHGSHTQIDVQR